MLHSFFRGERKAGLRLKFTQNQARDMVTERRSMFEPVPRSAAGKPYILHFRVAVYQKISVRSVFVLHTRVSAIGASRRQGIVSQRTRASSSLTPPKPHATAYPGRPQRRAHPAQSSVPGSRCPAFHSFHHSEKKSRQRWRRKARIAGWQPKIENFLPRHEESRPTISGKSFASHDRTQKQIARRNLLAGCCFDRPKWPLRFGLLNKRMNVCRSAPSRLGNGCRHSPPRHQHAALRLQNRAPNSVQANLRKSRAQPCRSNPHTSPRTVLASPASRSVAFGLHRKPQHARLLE